MYKKKRLYKCRLTVQWSGFQLRVENPKPSESNDFGQTQRTQSCNYTIKWTIEPELEIYTCSQHRAGESV